MKKLSIILSMILVLSLFMVATSQVYGSTNASNNDTLSAGVKPTKKVNEHSQGQSNNEKAKGKPVNIKGVIASVSAGSIVVTLVDGGSITVLISADTRISIASMGKEAGVTALLPGLEVGVQATEKDGVLTARSIHVIPGKPAKTHNVGVVTAYQAGVSISIAARDGKTYTFKLTPDVKILPVERINLLVAGAYVTVISPRDVTTTDLVATGIVIHPAVPPGQKITPQPSEVPAI